MPESITLEDGSTREVPTAEELEELQKKADEAASAKELQEQIKKQEEELEELRNQPGAEGIKNLRDALKRQKAALKAAGKELDEEGNVVEKQETITKEEVASVATAAVEAAAVVNMINQAKSHLDEDGKAVFDKEYKELVGDKEITQANAQKFIGATMSVSGLQSQAQAKRDPMAGLSGGSPSGTSSDAITSTTTNIAKGFGISKESLEKGGEINILNK